MARAGSLHVTVIAATLLRDSGGSDSEPADTYASVGCGSQNFTTSTVKNHRAKPAWNETHIFKFDERSDAQSQHILVEIFAEKPRLDELLGLARIPLQTVIKAGDEISTHALNRPHEEYTSREKYSGHVKVALKWDSAQRLTAAAYPQAYTPAARYNPNASLAKVHAFPGQTTTGRSEEKLQAGESGEEVQHPGGQDRKVHHRSSSCPSGQGNFSSSAPSPSQPLGMQPVKKDDISRPQQRPSNLRSTEANQTTSGHSRSHSSLEGPPNSFQQQEHGLQFILDGISVLAVQGQGSSRNVPYASLHIPYVSHEGATAILGISNKGHAVHGAIVQPSESGLADSNLKLQGDGAQRKLSKSKQAEMMKLAELSRLTQIATTEATGFARAGQQPREQPSARPNQSISQADQQGQVSSRPKVNNVQVFTQLSPIPERQKNNVSGVQQQGQAPLQQLSDAPHWPNPQSKELTVIPNMLDIVSVQPPKQQRDQKPEPLGRRQADRIYEKAIQKPENPDQKKKLTPLRQALKIFRKTTSKIFGL